MTRTIVTQSLFSTTPAESSWRSYVTSGVVHGLIILAALLITFPVIQTQILRRPAENVTLVAPQVPAYHPKVVLPRIPKTQPLVARAEPIRRPPPVIKPPEVKSVPVKPTVIASAPVIENTQPVAARPLPEPKFEVPAPKPEIQTGVFQTREAAKAHATPKVLKVGGFGDPNGVAPSADSRPSSVTLAKLGSFDLPTGGGTAGGGGRSASGGVRQTSFGSVGESSGAPGGTVRSGAVRTGAFGGASTVPGQVSPARSRPSEPAFTPVEITFKPKPVYTEEARKLKLEGQVSLQVVFLSSGAVKVLRVTRGLGHGLDEAAQQAALQVRFKPATRGGVPVDTNATINITFELT